MRRSVVVLGLLLIGTAVMAYDRAASRAGGAAPPLATGHAASLKMVLALKDPGTDSLLLSPDGTVLFVTLKQGRLLTVQAWDMSTMKRRRQFTLPAPGPGESFSFMASDLHGDLLPSISGVVYGTRSGKPIRRLSADVASTLLTEGAAPRGTMEISSYGSYMTALCQDAEPIGRRGPHHMTVKVWDMRTGRLLRSMRQPNMDVRIVGTARGTFIVRPRYTKLEWPRPNKHYGLQRLVDLEVLDAFSGKRVQRLRVDKPTPDALLLPDGRLVTIYGSVKRVTDVTTGRQLAVIGSKCPVQVLSPDCRWSVAAKNGYILPGAILPPGEIALWDTRSCRKVAVLARNVYYDGFSFTPDSRRLVVGYRPQWQRMANMQIKVWRLEGDHE